MKVQATSRKRKNAYGPYGRRRFTQRDMAILKVDTSILNSKAKRGELPKAEHRFYVCGCGAEGCFIPVMSD